MNIDELMALLAEAKKELGGDADVLRYDYGTSNETDLVRIEVARPVTFLIYEIGNGTPIRTQDDSRGTPSIRGLLLD